MRHFPTGLGYLFHTDEDNNTPFQLACQKYGRETATGIVDEALSAPTNDGEYVDSLVFLAANDIVPLDGVFVLVRRDPSLMVRVWCQGNRISIDVDAEGKG